jgi:hypothetical protein
MSYNIKLNLCILLVLLNLSSKPQNVGIGTLSPSARLHVADSSVLFTGPFTPNLDAAPPISGAGTRLMWFAERGALRAGTVYGVDWNKDSIGVNSIALGRAARATAEASVAFGNAKATNHNATAMGSAIASGAFSVAGGFGIASGYATVAFGSGIAVGFESSAFNVATAIGSYSFAAGYAVETKAFGSFSAGLFNDITDNPGTSVAATDRIFQIGNGQNNANRSNAITVLANGNTGIGVLNPTARLDVQSSGNQPQVIINQTTSEGYARIRLRTTSNINRHLGHRGSCQQRSFVR